MRRAPSEQTRSWYNCGKNSRGLGPSQENNSSISTTSRGRGDHFFLTDPCTGTSKGYIMPQSSQCRKWPEIAVGGPNQVTGKSTQHGIRSTVLHLIPASFSPVLTPHRWGHESSITPGRHNSSHWGCHRIK